MSTSQCATDPDLADPLAEPAQRDPQGASRPRSSVLVGSAATITIGLALASWYVGARIVQANESAPVSTAVEGPPKAATPVPAGPSTPEAAMAEAFWYTVPPPPPELFLQVASLGSRQDTSFVQWLEAKGYPARITKSRTGASATGSAADQEDSRILIGPFAGPTSLKKAERKLQSAGVLAIETTN